jgi:hypothetical protein
MEAQIKELKSLIDSYFEVLDRITDNGMEPFDFISEFNTWADIHVPKDPGMGWLLSFGGRVAKNCAILAQTKEWVLWAEGNLDKLKAKTEEIIALKKASADAPLQNA